MEIIEKYKLINNHVVSSLKEAETYCENLIGIHMDSLFDNLNFHPKTKLEIHKILCKNPLKVDVLNRWIQELNSLPGYSDD